MSWRPASSAKSRCPWANGSWLPRLAKHSAQPRAQGTVGDPQILVFGARAAVALRAVVVGPAEMDWAEHGVDDLLAISAEGRLMAAAAVDASSAVPGVQVQ
ncbi:MAG: hypothetical protein WCB86_02580 [Candidatus Dormiibacterota bacterium]